MAVYKQYYNAYEKKADEIRRAAKAIENGFDTSKATPLPEKKDPCASNDAQVHSVEPYRLFDKFASDDLLLLALIFLLFVSEKKDTGMLIILGYLLLCG